MEKKELVARLLAAKKASGKTYDEIAEPLGYCNVPLICFKLLPGSISD